MYDATSAADTESVKIGRSLSLPYVSLTVVDEVSPNITSLVVSSVIETSEFTELSINLFCGISII